MPRNDCVIPRNDNVTLRNDSVTPRNGSVTGSKRTIQHLEAWLSSNGYNFESLWSNITDIVIKTVIVAEPFLLHSYRMARPGTTSGSPESVCFEVIFSNCYCIHYPSEY